MCQAVTYADGSKRCERCDLLWDMNDPDPPECRTAHDIAIDDMRKQLPIKKPVN